MEKEIIEMREPTPILKSKKCKIMMYGLYIFLRGFSIGAMMFIYVKYGWFWGFVAFVFSYIIIGIIKSKLRMLSIPIFQLEYDYTDKEIASWYIYKNFCDE